MKIAVVSASLSESSTTDQLGRAMAGALARKTQAETDVISLRELAHAITDNMLTGIPSPALEAAFDRVRSADAVIAVTPAYNASFSGLFKSFFDVLPLDYMRGKPVAIGATGGTPRHSLVTEHAIRPLLTYLRAFVVPTAVYAATEDFGAHAADSDGQGGASLASRIQRAANEILVTWQATGGGGAELGLGGVGQAGINSGGGSAGRSQGSRAGGESVESQDSAVRDSATSAAPSAATSAAGLDDASGPDTATSVLATASDVETASDQDDIKAAKAIFADFKSMDELFAS